MGNWIRRHLNWAWVISVVLVWLVAVFVGICMIWAEPSVSENAMNGAVYPFCYILWIIISGVVLKAKGRSLWWILLSGWLSPLWLSNNKIEEELL